MKTTRRRMHMRLFRTLWLTGVVLGILFAVPAGAASIGFVAPGPYTVLTGDAFTVDVVVSGLGTQVVSAYDLDIGFDPNVLKVTSLTQNLVLGDDTLFEAFYSAQLFSNFQDIAGVSLLSDADLFTLQGGGPLTLARLGFEAIADGTTSVDFLWGGGQDVKGR